MKKLDMKTTDKTITNVEQIAQLFPNVVSEGKIDFDLLKQMLSGEIVESDDERYRLDWVGKKASLLKVNTAIDKTLRPCKEESVDFDNTENLYIEGDNFEVLKLLQESYLNKVKMIYIDPPYNTGKDFVYSDNFTKSKTDFEDEIGLRDEDDNKLFKNTDSNGRFHSDWLSMMYERLLVSRDLLKDDGVIFISIDDNEVHNLRKICDEVFGEGNFQGHIHWRRRHNQPNDKTKMIGLVAEHILCYSKNKDKYKESGVGKIELTGDFSNPDNDPKGDWASKPWKVGSDQSGSQYKIISPTGVEFDEDWMGEYNTYKNYIEEGRIYFTKNGNGIPRKKYYRFEREEEGQCATNWWMHDKFGHNQEANEETTILFGQKNIFSNPKPTLLIKNLINISNAKNDDIILDFFAGSSSASDAVLQFNYVNSESIKFINVQLPENLDESLVGADAKTKKQIQGSISFLDSIHKKHLITEIGKERIRRAGKKILADNEALKEPKDLSKLDIGFRVLKIDSSNMKDVYYHPNKLSQGSIPQLEFNIKEDRTDLDLLFQIMLDLGVELSLKISPKVIDGTTIYILENSELVACMSDDISIEVIEEIKKIAPYQVVLKDSCFKEDKDKINAVESLSKVSTVSVI